MTSAKSKEVEGARHTKYWLILLMVVHGFGGRGFSLSGMQNFLHLCGCLVLHCFFEASLQLSYRKKKRYKGL